MSDMHETTDLKIVAKFGFFTDLHARNDTPAQRIDNFKESLLIKLHEIGQIFIKENVDFVAFGGDLGHTPDPSYSLANPLMRELKSWNLPIVGVVGSHDYFGYQKITIDRTVLGNLVSAGVITLVDDEIYYKSPNDKVIVTGNRHQYDSTDHPERLNIRKIDENALLQVQLVHCDLYHQAVPWPHILIQNVTTQSDLVLSGHIHSGWEEPITINNTTFFNPGSIARLEKSKTQRIPRVVIIEVWSDKSVKIRSVYLTTALPHPFKDDVSEFESEEVTAQDIDRLVNFIETSTVEMTDIKGLLRAFAKNEGFSEESIEITFELLDKVKQST